MPDLTNVNREIERVGFAIAPDVLDDEQLAALRVEFPASAEPQRDLLARESIRALVKSASIRHCVDSLLAGLSFAVRALFFNKTPDSNWKVAWHQDLTIAVAERREIEGYTSWSVKHGTHHVQPSAAILENILAVRIHLDDSTADNGPLRCVPASHTHGRLSAAAILAYDKSHAVACTAPARSALLMRPLVLHASSLSIAASPRRIIHIEFTNAHLPNGLRWHDAF